ncbi:MAG: carboxyltransferase domain-containing protein [Hyphomonas sp.]
MAGHRLFLIGDNAVAIQPEDRQLRHPLAHALRASRGWIDVVPGKQVVALQFDPMIELPSEALQRAADWLDRFQPEEMAAGAFVDLHLDVSGESAPDIDMVADRNGISAEDVLQRVIGSELIVDMLGFTPGFAYVEGVDAALYSERLASPRQRVAAGSVGFVSGQLGFYGLSGPGGWPIIGRLTETLFDPARDEPFLLQEGQRIRLHLVDV